MSKNVEEDTFEEFLDLLCQDDKFQAGGAEGKIKDILKTFLRPGQGDPAKIDSTPCLDIQETGFSEENNNRADMV